MALVAMASSAAALEYGVFSCKVGRTEAHCQAKNNRFKPFFYENQHPEVQWRWMSDQSDWKVDKLEIDKIGSHNLLRRVAPFAASDFVYLSW